MLRVLGAVAIDGHGAVRSAAQRTILSALALDAGASVSSDRLADLVWGDEQPVHPSGALQSQVSRLRRIMPAGMSIEPTATGYRLDAEPAAIDATALDARWGAACDVATADRVDVVDAALALWRGEPYHELTDDDRAMAERARLESVRWALRVLRAEALLAADRLDEAIVELEAQRAEAPLRERSVELLMRAYVEAGRRNEALAEYQRLRRDLVEELGLDPSPELRALEAAILTEEVVAPPSSERTVHPRATASGIELPTSTFVGRAVDVGRVREFLDRGRIVTVAGPGGVGKTRLALQAGSLVAGDFDDGAVFVDLTEIRDADRLDELLVSALDVPARHGASALELVLSALGDRNQLLVIDNCEHVIDAAAAFAEAATRRAGGVSILATSREPLNIDGERVIRLHPLDVETDAVDLFLDRAAGHGRGEVGKECMPLVRQICVALDGLPLAVELAAARLASMSLEEIIAGLDERLVLFSKGRRTAHERHRSLRALVDWSVRSLEPELGAVLAEVSVFAAPFTADGAAAVTGRPPGVTRHAIGELVDRSLLVEHRRDGRPTRYGFLETIRAYAAELLDGDDGAAAVLERHGDWVLGRVEALRALMPDRPDAEASDDLIVELADVRFAHRRFCDGSDADRSLRLAAALHFVALFRMHAEMFGWVREAADRFGDTDHRLAEDVLGSASIGRWVTGDLDGAREYAERAQRRAAVSTYPGAGRAAEEASADVVSFGGDHARALASFERAGVLAREQGDMARVAADLADGAMVAGYLRDADRVRAAVTLAHEVIGPHGSDLLGAWVSYAEGEAFAEIDPARAMTALGAALSVADRCSLHFITGVAGLTLTGLQVRGGDAVDAAEHLVDLLEHWRRAGAWLQQEITLRTVIDLLVREGLHDDAATLIGFVSSSSGAAETAGPDADRLRAARIAVSDSCPDAGDLMVAGMALTRDEASDRAVAALRRLHNEPRQDREAD